MNSNFITRRHLLVSVVLSFLSKTSTASLEIRPEEFGAKGDGLHSDGPAFAKLVKYVNSLDDSISVSINCRGHYLLGDSERIKYPPRQTKDMGGLVHGIPMVTKGNLTIDARGAVFEVPTSFLWRRTKKGGDEHDRFFVGWQLYGPNTLVKGGTFLGNLSKRNVVRGNNISGFGGKEFGFVLGGDNWKLLNVRCEEWGTDCVLAGASGEMVGCTLKRGRRNNVSVVPFRKDCNVLIRNCDLEGAGNWHESIRNRPGSAIQIEAGRRGFKTKAVILENRFADNKEKDLQLSHGAINCSVVKNTFRSALNIRPGNLGGHSIIKNMFIDGGYVGNIFGFNHGLRILFQGNKFSGKLVNSKDIKRLRRGAEVGQKPTVKFIDNEKI